MSAADSDAAGYPRAASKEMALNVSAHVPSGATAVVVGVDLIEHERLKLTYRRHGERFLRRVFTPGELRQGAGRIERLAGRFAAKEACAKALGTGIGQVGWREIEIERLPGGKPAILLHGRAAARAAALGLTAFDVSISDTHHHTLAVVVALRDAAGARDATREE